MFRFAQHDKVINANRGGAGRSLCHPCRSPRNWSPDNPHPRRQHWIPPPISKAERRLIRAPTTSAFASLKFPIDPVPSRRRDSLLRPSCQPLLRHSPQAGSRPFRISPRLACRSAWSTSRVHEKPCRVSVQRAFNIEVSIRVESHRDPRKTATGQETRETLAHGESLRR